MFERYRRKRTPKSLDIIWVFLIGFFCGSSIFVATPHPAFGQSPAPLNSAGTNVLISKKDCDRVVKHVPDADVAFKPGIDVRGKPVAPADLGGGSALTLPDMIEFNLTVDVLNELGVSSDSPLAPEAPEGDVTLGTITYDLLSGAVTFNGQPLGDPELAAIAAGCRAAQQDVAQ
jgi:hypothetical protein